MTKNKSKLKPRSEPIVRATLRLPQSVWDAIQHRAIDEHTTTSQLVATAMSAYLKGGRS